MTRMANAFAQMWTDVDIEGGRVVMMSEFEMRIETTECIVTALSDPTMKCVQSLLLICNRGRELAGGWWGDRGFQPQGCHLFSS